MHDSFCQLHTHKNASKPSSSQLIAAVLTPCRQPGQIDVTAMGRFCQRLAADGCNGLFVAGSTGEMPLLDAGQRQALVAAARQATPQATRIYAGINGTGLKQMMRCARQVANVGADAVVAMAPFFCKLDQRELRAYFTALADSSPLPLVLYHHLRMPSAISVEAIADLMTHPNIIAIKDTSTDRQRMGQIVAAVQGQDVAVYQGHERLILSSLEHGATGCMTALANVVPQWHRALLDAWDAGNRVEAQKQQETIDGLAELFKLPPVTQSFAHFTYALRRAAHRGGRLDQTHGMVLGFESDGAFDRQIDAVLSKAAPHVLSMALSS